VVIGADPEVISGVDVTDDLVGIETALRVEGRLDLYESRVNLGAEELAFFSSRRRHTRS